MKHICKLLLLITILLFLLKCPAYASEEIVAGFDTNKLNDIDLEDLVSIKLNNLENKREQILKEYGTENRFTEKEIEILERITEAEAEGEGLIGKILVVNVILNRLNDERFENTIKDIVFAKNQFEPIRDGRYKKVTISDETKYAVSLVVDFGLSISDKILFFHSVKVKEFSNYTKLFTYKNHIFYTC